MVPQAADGHTLTGENTRVRKIVKKATPFRAANHVEHITAPFNEGH
jgi:hypothetical protein